MSSVQASSIQGISKTQMLYLLQFRGSFGLEGDCQEEGYEDCWEQSNVEEAKSEEEEEQQQS